MGTNGMEDFIFAFLRIIRIAEYINATNRKVYKKDIYIAVEIRNPSPISINRSPSPNFFFKIFVKRNTKRTNGNANIKEFSCIEFWVTVYMTNERKE